MLFGFLACIIAWLQAFLAGCRPRLYTHMLLISASEMKLCSWHVSSLCGIGWYQCA